MITGRMTEQRTAAIALHLRGTRGQVETVDAVIDTGFNGFLTLPLPQIARLRFPYEGNIEAVLGDGREVKLDIFMGTVVWEGRHRDGVVLAADGSPLVGVALLAGHRVTLEISDNGSVSIEPLPGAVNGDTL
jgi:clan AA aspartic protease